MKEPFIRYVMRGAFLDRLFLEENHQMKAELQVLGYVYCCSGAPCIVMVNCSLNLGVVVLVLCFRIDLCDLFSAVAFLGCDCMLITLRYT